MTNKLLWPFIGGLLLAIGLSFVSQTGAIIAGACTAVYGAVVALNVWADRRSS